ncbi:hypothetical protein BpHYR1_026227 [Brachionus plicatilis]|uniref:Uncharacterized protein n=1 Tax=Brachionus plicatilis TaxID=10195 RepID=A0A3M7T3X8_BRAPC|nr:hypothetical protein BpHYR1_026227 [Brachionus plicatilis]
MANLGLLKDWTKTEGEIAVLVGVSQKCVNTNKRNFQVTSMVNNYGNCGRRPKLSNRDVSTLDKWGRVLAKKGIESYSAVKKPLQSVSDRTKWCKWCKERRNWTDKDWG